MQHNGAFNRILMPWDSPLAAIISRDRASQTNAAWVSINLEIQRDCDISDFSIWRRQNRDRDMARSRASSSNQNDRRRSKSRPLHADPLDA